MLIYKALLHYNPKKTKRKEKFYHKNTKIVAEIFGVF